jgi:hypothetical protein
MVARGRAVLAVAALAGLLTACTSQLDLAEPADTAPRAAAQPLAVHDMPAARDTRPMTAEERQRVMDELAAARERHQETTGTVPARTPPAR